MKKINRIAEIPSKIKSIRVIKKESEKSKEPRLEKEIEKDKFVFESDFKTEKINPTPRQTAIVYQRQDFDIEPKRQNQGANNDAGKSRQLYAIRNDNLEEEIRRYEEPAASQRRVAPNVLPIREAAINQRPVLEMFANDPSKLKARHEVFREERKKYSAPEGSKRTRRKYPWET